MDGKDISKIVKGAVEPITSTLGDSWSALIGDRVAAYRLKNAAKLQLKVKAEFEKLGVSLLREKLPDRYALAWFEEATKQDEDEIQELFARLLARAALGDKDALDRRLLDLLSKMTPIDAAVLSAIYSESDEMHGHDLAFYLKRSIQEFSLINALNQDFPDDAVRSLEHLVNIGIIERDFYVEDRSVQKLIENIKRQIGQSAGFVRRPELNMEMTYRLTETGQALMMSVRPI